MHVLPLLLMLGLLVGVGCRSTQPAAVVMPLDQVLLPLLDSLHTAHPELTLGISVVDPATRTRFEHNPDRRFHAASTMKVPVMIEVYRQAGAGQLSLDDSLLVRNAFRSIVDGSPYSISDDSDDVIYTKLEQPISIRDLVYQMITVSSNLATNLLIQHVTAEAVQGTATRLGVRTMRVLRGVEDGKAFEQGLNNTATARDLATLMGALMEHRAVSPEADQRMIGVLLAQQFNEMIPAGLPAGTRVAHKTGQITRIHHDAAIVYPAQGAPYVLVLLLEGIADEDVSARVGARIARVVHQHLRPE
jgi:beta-lactamase class A